MNRIKESDKGTGIKDLERVHSACGALMEWCAALRVRGAECAERKGEVAQMSILRAAALRCGDHGGRLVLQLVGAHLREVRRVHGCTRKIPQSFLRGVDPSGASKRRSCRRRAPPVRRSQRDVPLSEDQGV
jgi:hypothetical protein